MLKPFQGLFFISAEHSNRKTPPPSDTPSSHPHKLPLRWLLVVPFVVQISLAVGLTGYFSLRNGQRAVDTLADRLLLSTTEQVNQYLEAYLATPHRIVQVNANLLEQGILSPADRDRWGQHFWQQRIASPQISYIGLASTDGHYIGVGNWLEGYEQVLDETSPDGQTRTYSLDENGRKLEEVYDYEYLPLEEQWYERAIATNGSFWDLSIEYVEPFYIAAGVVQAVYAANGERLGVISADLTLSDISLALERLNPSSSGQLLIVERDGQLVANAEADELLVRQGDELLQRQLGSLNDPTLQAIAQHIDTQLGGLTNIQQTQIFSVGTGRDRHFVQLTPWQDELGLDWVVVLAIPESEFMAQIHANTRTTVYLCLVALAVAIGLGMLTARQIARPIGNLTEASRAIATTAQHPGTHAALAKRIEPQAIAELEDLAISFNQMAERLQQAFDDLGTANAQLEQNVQQRTQALSEALEDLKRTQAQLVQAAKMSGLGQLVAGIAHEINNPTTFIYANLSHVQDYSEQLLALINRYQQHYPNPPDDIQALSDDIDLTFIRDDLSRTLYSIRSGATRIRTIVDSLRSFARVNESVYKATQINTDLDNTLVVLNQQLQPHPQGNSILVVKQYGDLPLVECFPGQLNQVFMNMLINAIDAIREKQQTAQNQGYSFTQGRITLTTEVLSDDAVQISIRDNGIGIREEVRSHIFNPFFTTKPIGKGTGLGLSICYQIIVDQHGGTLDCYSEPGEGTEFVIHLPISQDTIMRPESTLPRFDDV